MKRILFYLVLILLWELAYRVLVTTLHICKPYIFPSPIEVVKTFIYLFTDGKLISAIVISLKRLMIGYLLSLIAGFFIGIVIAKWKLLKDNLNPLFLGIQTLPTVCWIPFSILLFGLGEEGILFLIFIGSVFSIAIGIENAISNINPLYTKAAITMGAKGFTYYKSVVLFAAMPQIVAAMKQGWSFAWRALLAGEMMFAAVGIGQVLTIGRDIGDITMVIAVMITITTMGILFDKFIFGSIQNNIDRKYGR